MRPFLIQDTQMCSVHLLYQNINTILLGTASWREELYAALLQLSVCSAVPQDAN
jgi:hypothetical protein